MPESKKDQEETKENQIQEDSKNEEDLEGLADQVRKEYDIAYKFMEPKFEAWRKRLKVYNNQLRENVAPEAVGDTTMYSILQTVLASLYSDQLNVEFSGVEEGDTDVADNLTQMAKFDYTKMRKSELDYFWDWNTLFFGRALVSIEEFRRDKENGIFLPLPVLIDPLTWLRDPNATSVHGGNTGEGAMRYGGREVLMSEEEMKDHPSFTEEIDHSSLTTEFTIDSPFEKARTARNEAQNRQEPLGGKYDLGENTVYPVTEWSTLYDGKKVKVWLDGGRDKVLGKKEFEDNMFPYVDRAMSPTSGDWDGTSIPDITEDKQRSRAVILNLCLRAMKAGTYPTYLFDEDKITNRRDLSLGFNKFIPGKGKGQHIGNAIHPVQRAPIDLGLLDFVYRNAELSAEKATATTGIQQGALTEGDKTLGEIEAAGAKADTRFSLAAKVFGWSETLFWQFWYKRYKNNLADKIDKKVMRIVGAGGAEWRELSRENIIAIKDPDVTVTSTFVIEQEELKERTLLSQYIGLALQEPTINRRYALKKLGRVHGLESDEVKILFPPTVDELIADEENEGLNDNSLEEVFIEAEQDHVTHMEVHIKAKDTDAREDHMKAHRQAMAVKKEKPELFNKTDLEAEFSGDEELPSPTPKPVAKPPTQVNI